MKRALLILIGGRQTPNILTALYLRPDIIAPVASREAMAAGGEWSQVKAELASICPDGLQEPQTVDAFDIEEIRQSCEKAAAAFPDAEWFFNLTCASKIMGFGALEIARKINASAWYLTDKRRVVTLCGSAPAGDLFKISVKSYFAGFGRDCVFQLAPSEKLFDFAAYLANSSDKAMRFRDSLRASGFSGNKKGQTKTAILTSQAGFVADFCQRAKNAELVADFRRVGSAFEITAVGCELWNFFNGDWLEYFVYSAAKDARCFDDQKFGVKIPGETGENELDLAATVTGSLLLAECKTEKDFNSDHLDKLSSISNLVGGNYVSRVFISSCVVKEYQEKSFESFCGQAQARRIVVVTGAELKNLKRIFQDEAINPKFKKG